MSSDNRHLRDVIDRLERDYTVTIFTKYVEDEDDMEVENE